MSELRDDDHASWVEIAHCFEYFSDALKIDLLGYARTLRS
jgi:hypothetical protein